MPTAPASPRDPLRNYQFRISLEVGGIESPVGGVQRVSGLTCSVTSFDVWEGGNNFHRYANPDKLNWDPVTLEQGLILDESLELWAEAVRHFAMTGTSLLKDGRPVPVKRNVIIDFVDPQITVDPMTKRPRARRYKVENAWLSKFTAVPRLDAMGSEVALVLAELIHEGWRPEPVPPAPSASTATA